MFDHRHLFKASMIARLAKKRRPAAGDYEDNQIILINLRQEFDNLGGGIDIILGRERMIAEVETHAFGRFVTSNIDNDPIGNPFPENLFKLEYRLKRTLPDSDNEHSTLVRERESSIRDPQLASDERDSSPNNRPCIKR